MPSTSNFVRLKIDDTIETLCAATAPACRDPSGVVPAAILGQTLGEGLDRTTFPKLRTVDQHQPALARRRRLVRLECHAFCLPLLGGAGSRTRLLDEGPRSVPGCRLCGHQRPTASNRDAHSAGLLTGWGVCRKGLGPWGQAGRQTAPMRFRLDRHPGKRPRRAAKRPGFAAGPFDFRRVGFSPPPPRHRTGGHSIVFALVFGASTMAVLGRPSRRPAWPAKALGFALGGWWCYRPFTFDARATPYDRLPVICSASSFGVDGDLPKTTAPTSEAISLDFSGHDRLHDFTFVMVLALGTSFHCTRSS